jgi:hypothetical protein
MHKNICEKQYLQGSYWWPVFMKVMPSMVADTAEAGTVIANIGVTV